MAPGGSRKGTGICSSPGCGQPPAPLQGGVAERCLRGFALRARGAQGLRHDTDIAISVTAIRARGMPWAVARKGICRTAGIAQPESAHEANCTSPVDCPAKQVLKKLIFFSESACNPFWSAIVLIPRFHELPAPAHTLLGRARSAALDIREDLLMSVPLSPLVLLSPARTR